MKLEYLSIDNITDNGKYSREGVSPIMRLYDFDKMQASEFRRAIEVTIIKNNKPLNLQNLIFIEALNCNLTLRLADKDIGLITDDKKKFFCDLTLNGYKNMAYLLEPFCEKDTYGYQWLYDNLNEIEFLFSASGKW